MTSASSPNGHDEWVGSDGTYTTDGNALTLVESNHQFEYCVDGNTLTLKRLNTETDRRAAS